MRPSGRTPDRLRTVSLETGFSKYAEGSCLVRFGDTHVLAAASVEQRVPSWMRDTGRGWVTAEYGMLPAPPRRAPGARRCRASNRDGPRKSSA